MQCEENPHERHSSLRARPACGEKLNGMRCAVDLIAPKGGSRVDDALLMCSGESRWFMIRGGNGDEGLRAVCVRESAGPRGE